MEDEFHFLFDCSEYAEERKKLNCKVEELKYCTSQVEKFQKLNIMPFTFANFISILWEKRKTLIGTSLE